MFVNNYLFEYLFSVLWGIYLAVSSWVIVSGEAHGLRPAAPTPTPARHHSDHLHVVLQQEVSTNQKSSGKIKRRHYLSDHLPESFSLASILAEQDVHHQEGL